MRIAIDARELLGRPTGVGRYLTHLLSAWDVLPSAAAHEFILCAPRGADLPARGARVSTCLGGTGSGTWWEQLTLPGLVRRAQADVLFSPAYTGPLRCGVPMVLAVHDVSFAAHPEWFARQEGLRRRMLARLSARTAARVITISGFSRGEIARHLGIPETKIDVIYPAAEPVAVPRPNDNRENVVLFVGSIFSRRHVPELIDGFARVARQHRNTRLELVGENRTAPPIDLDAIVSASGVAGQVTLRSYVPEDLLAALYASARAFVFLSDYEGFGLTPLEALAAGIPIVVLDTPVAREVYGEAALYVPRPDPALIGAALEQVLFDAAERSRILGAAPRTLARYSWTACAEGVLKALTRCGRIS
ncbi:MAG: hypothetical protein A3H29_17760 [Acidobacteria bacterium RIFCSPLOWO2_02_FULL_67_21]|nr:MAG: hypothetical protein A3H29_17760 [Acidobacteria bacterium RIFCSPLOWO2_02_FULL_67_21]